MVKVLIYSSKEIYDKASYEGRAEADIVAYANANGYWVLKDRTKRIGLRQVYGTESMHRMIEWAERDEFNRELDRINQPA